MKKDSAKSKKLTDLREQAEEILRRNTGGLQQKSDKDVQGLVHELQVHQIELEMQNEELRRAQLELEESRNRYSDLYDFAPIGYFTFDKNGIILEVNLTGASKLGMERSFLIKKPFSLYIAPEGKDVFYLHLRQVFKTKTQQTCEIKLLSNDRIQFDARLESLFVQDSENKSGQCRTAINDITESKRAEEMLRLAHDELEIRVRERTEELAEINWELQAEITERKRTEKELFEINQRLQALMQAVPVGVSFSDDITCRRITGNPAVLVQFDIGPEDNLSASAPETAAAGRQVRYFLNGRQISSSELPLQRAVAENREISPVELEIELPSGRRWFAEASGAPIRDAQGKVIAGLAVTVDITERKKLGELVLENERLISANRARSEFMTIISHELRTPLTSIIGYSIILKEMAHGKLNQKQEFYIDNILASSKHLLDVINDILDIAKVEAGKLELLIETVPLPGTISEILSLMNEMAKMKKTILKKELDPQLAHIEADRHKFKQILFNLISNAMKFSKEDGGIIIISTKKEGDMAKISVSDTGIGIREEDISKLFQKFGQLDSGLSRKYNGAGLGLAITKQLVELHEGKIMVESKYGEGSNFTFFLPVEAKNKEQKRK